eukprot:scaffold44986_cov57-Phaeocystis_antarctica.AAC.1
MLLHLHHDAPLRRGRVGRGRERLDLAKIEDAARLGLRAVLGFARVLHGRLVIVVHLHGVVQRRVEAQRQTQGRAFVARTLKPSEMK